MAGGIRYDENGDFNDAEHFGDIDDYSEEDQAYNDMADQAHMRLNGETLNDGKNTAGFGKFGKRQGEDGSSKYGLLRKGEQEASKKPNIGGKGGDKTASLGEKEKNVKSDSDEDSTQDGYGGKINNAVRGIKDIQQGKVGKGTARLKKAGPVATIIAFLGISIYSSLMGQMAMPASMISQFQDTFDSISASQSMRSRHFLRFQTGNDKIKGCIKAHYFKADEFKVSKRQKNKLAKSGISFEEDADGVTVMKYEGLDGQTKTIVADEKLATGDRVSFDSIYESDPNFHKAYNDGSRTWKGAIAAWFDSSMNKLLAHLGINRNNFDDFSNKNNADAQEEVKNKITEDADSDGVEGKTKNSEPEKETKYDDDGNPEGEKKTGRSKKTSEDDVSFKKGDTEIDTSTGKPKVEGKLKTLADKFDKASGFASTAVNFICGVMDFIGTVSILIAAYQTTQVLAMASNIFEGIQKGQIEDSSSAPINQIGNLLTQPKTNTYTETTDIKKTSSGDYESDTSKDKTITRTRSAMEAEGIGALYGRTSVDMTDPSVKSLNINTVLNNAYGKIGSIAMNVSTGAAAFRSCATARLAAAAVGASEKVLDIALFIGTGGLGNLAKWFAEEAVKITVSFAFSAAVSIAISFITPYIVQMLTRKVVTEVAGEDLGNMLVDGANIYMGQNHQFSGGAPANKEKLIAYLQERDKIAADNARYDRESRSPFDITSKNTFLGSLATKMVPLASSMTSITGAVNGASTVIGNAVQSLTPNSSAVSAAIEAQAASDQTEKYCPDMYAINAVGDAFCNPYIITDTSTMQEHPANIVNTIDSEYEGFENQGQESDEPAIKKDSNLAKYIIYCGQRTSPWGMVDQNISGDIDSLGQGGGSVGNSIGDAALGALPVVGDGLDIMSNTKKLRNMGWITGSACVVGNNSQSSHDGMNDGGDQSIDWKEAKEYQRFIEDQRLAEAEGVIEESAVTKFVAEYYEEHPIDNSYEGILARYSGLTKEQVIATLDFVDVVGFLTEYEPKNLYPYPVTEESIQQLEIDENDLAIPGIFAQIRDTIFDNRRYRNFAA